MLQQCYITIDLFIYIYIYIKKKINNKINIIK